ncbi:DNA-binding transcriptional regulator, LacI/PurR family [Paenibacillus algorifonticola]|uniref:DNA-binding transcriptional regulator, LacI/PurR family n=1 Tax=Paenibacillus algorifonticola TaxID=684063 RepID=A0A1I2GDL4_9BACL|nr:GntR family transcriptional regulator [Paenibacillus algorifonticola]SFF15007.1 DNA-binding transcriptional regulator, LacI/PurR family [Paenibacillus algorifonticola]
MEGMNALKPRYEQMYLMLREKIQIGDYTVGDRIPSEKELMEEFSVSRITSKKALDMLVQDGYIMRQPGRGSFVIEHAIQEQGEASPAQEPVSASVRTQQIVLGLIMEDFSDSYGKEMLSEMERTAQALGVYLMLRISFSQPDVEEKAIQMLRQYGVDGLIIYPTRGQNFSPEILKLVIDKFPHVLVDRYLKWTDTTAISSDNVEAARMGVQHLFNYGHRHIGLLASRVTDNVAIEERIEGFVQAHAEGGILLDRSSWLTDMNWTSNDNSSSHLIDKYVKIIQQMLREHPRITALFAMEYELALIAKEAVEKMGLQIPQQISIICFDSPQSTSALYPFTHLEQNEKEIGRLAVNNVLELIQGATLPSKISLQVKLVPGKSTGPAPQ